MNNIENMSLNQFDNYLNELINQFVESHQEEYQEGKINYFLNKKIKNISNIDTITIIKDVPLDVYIRNLKEIRIWRNNIIKKYNGKCFISGETYDEVHHITSFLACMVDTLNELGLDRRKYIADYSEEELDNITNIFIEKHKNIDAILLTQKLHYEFHYIFGKYCFDEKDLELFIKYKNNEIELDIRKIQKEKYKEFKNNIKTYKPLSPENILFNILNKIINDDDYKQQLIESNIYDENKGISKIKLRELVGTDSRKTFNKAINNESVEILFKNNNIIYNKNSKYIKF